MGLPLAFLAVQAENSVEKWNKAVLLFLFTAVQEKAENIISENNPHWAPL
jgi:hypothetical protein